MAAPFRLTPAAEEQVGDIVAFIAAGSEEAAVRVRDAFYSAFELLANQPEIGHARHDLTSRPLKFCRVYSYLVVYDPASVPVIVLSVLHGARDVEQILKSLD